MFYKCLYSYNVNNINQFKFLEELFNIAGDFCRHFYVLNIFVAPADFIILFFLLRVL